MLAMHVERLKYYIEYNIIFFFNNIMYSHISYILVHSTPLPLHTPPTQHSPLNRTCLSLWISIYYIS